MYALFSGNRNISLPNDPITTKTEAIGAAITIVQGNCCPERLRHPAAKPPRAIRIVGIKGSAKNAVPVTVVALGHRRQRVEVR